MCQWRKRFTSLVHKSQDGSALNPTWSVSGTTILKLTMYYTDVSKWCESLTDWSVPLRKYLQYRASKCCTCQFVDDIELLRPRQGPHVVVQKHCQLFRVQPLLVAASCHWGLWQCNDAECRVDPKYPPETAENCAISSQLMLPWAMQFLLVSFQSNFVNIHNDLTSITTFWYVCPKSVRHLDKTI